MSSMPDEAQADNLAVKIVVGMDPGKWRGEPRAEQLLQDAAERLCGHLRERAEQAWPQAAIAVSVGEEEEFVAQEDPDGVPRCLLQVVADTEDQELAARVGAQVQAWTQALAAESLREAGAASGADQEG